MKFEINHGDSFELLKALPENSVDSVVTDPPYGIRFMGKAWDGADIEKMVARRRGFNSHDQFATEVGGHKSIAAEAGTYDFSAKGLLAFQIWTMEWAQEVLRVLKPGGHLLAFAAPRSFHRLVTGLEDAGFEIRDHLQWIFGSGFPKSKNLSGKWAGWGTSLKPAFEPICLARKPFDQSVEANVNQFGTGALNINDCRIPVDALHDAGQLREINASARNSDSEWGMSKNGHTSPAVRAEGRWPTNVLLDGSDEVILGFPYTRSGASCFKKDSGANKNGNTGSAYGKESRPAGAEMVAYGDQGSASRFFYCGKASRQDRNEGLFNGNKPLLQQNATMRHCETVDWSTRNGNHHPTVKPTDLMRYLVRLITPKGGTTLDPFCGSGSTGKAALLEGINFIGMDQELDYVQIARSRCQFVLDEINNKHPDLFENV